MARFILLKHNANLQNIDQKIKFTLSVSDSLIYKFSVIYNQVLHIDLLMIPVIGFDYLADRNRNVWMYHKRIQNSRKDFTEANSFLNLLMQIDL